MDMFREEQEFTDIRTVQRVMDMFEGRSQMQRMINLRLIGMEYDALDDTDEDDYAFTNFGHAYNHFHGYTRDADMSDNKELSRNRTRSKESVYQPTLQYWAARDFIRPAPIEVQLKESNTERRACFLQETKKRKEKAQKKRLKKQKQKERRRLEKIEKEKINPDKMEEEKVDAKQSKAEESTSVDEKTKDGMNASVKEFASVEHTDSSDSSEDESDHEDSDTKNDSGDSEDLDMTSTFVKLAKLKLEQKPKPEKKEKKKVLVKEERKSIPEKSNEVPEAVKKDSATSRSPTIEENIKMSTELAIIGNTFAGSGDYPMAVKYFTDAIKFNPTEFKLFGNRSFCFEKMQEHEKALTDAELCLRLCPGWVKGLFRKGRALAGLKRYEEAAQAFREVLQLDSACGEAAQELMRVQITQLMEYGFTREQSSNALIIHGTVKKALEVLTKINPQPGASPNATLLPVQVANVTGVSPVLSASTSPSPARPKDAQPNNPLGPVKHMSNVHSQHKSIQNHATSQVNKTPPELFPVWIGNLTYPVPESVIGNLFNKVGFVYSVKVLTVRRCAFVNYTKQEHCEEAIRRFHGFELNGMKIAVRYPDRIPHGMGMSKTALKADDQHDENMRQQEYGDERNAFGGRRPLRSYRHVPDHKN
ncbi:uncharacterized protein LOC114867216 [Betta splendens]|uniref:Uncharacterized protein LOC114867216 n=1 Tax=Betta splendens TaxID=158456 RepID=A0A6P7P657_BETSP|nr:uncharacterized protein LOC114867216 [Betta splendens]